MVAKDRRRMILIRISVASRAHVHKIKCFRVTQRTTEFAQRSQTGRTSAVLAHVALVKSVRSCPFMGRSAPGARNRRQQFPVVLFGESIGLDNTPRAKWKGAKVLALLLTTYWIAHWPPEESKFAGSAYTRYRP
jgi:hypothetical protein